MVFVEDGRKEPRSGKSEESSHSESGEYSHHLTLSNLGHQPFPAMEPNPSIKMEPIRRSPVLLFNFSTIASCCQYCGDSNFLHRWTFWISLLVPDGPFSG